MLLHTSKHLDATVTLTASKPNKTGMGCTAPTSPLSWARNRHISQNENATHKTVNTQSFPA